MVICDHRGRCTGGICDLWGFIYGISLNYTVHILINTQTGALGGLEGMVCGEAPYIYRGGGGGGGEQGNDG